jgi:hypothetical protein
MNVEKLKCKEYVEYVYACEFGNLRGVVGIDKIRIKLHNELMKIMGLDKNRCFVITDNLGDYDYDYQTVFEVLKNKKECQE